MGALKAEPVYAYVWGGALVMPLGMVLVAPGTRVPGRGNCVAPPGIWVAPANAIGQHICFNYRTVVFLTSQLQEMRHRMNHRRRIYQMVA